MGMFDWFTGTTRPERGVVAQSPGAVHAALLAANREDAPFVIRDGTPEGVDLVAEWRIVDFAWYDFFVRARVQKANQTLMRLDLEKNEVRALDQEWSVVWHNGVPELSPVREYGRGQINKSSRRITFGRNSEGKMVTESDQSFPTGEFKPVLREVVTSAGWTWRGVVFGKP
ncbi:hypothetical protein [Parasphingorhabdus pacifica]